MPLVAETKKVPAKKEMDVGESYEDWRDRILKKAYAELALLDAGTRNESWKSSYLSAHIQILHHNHKNHL